jgi:hypothetical protein
MDSQGQGDTSFINLLNQDYDESMGSHIQEFKMMNQNLRLQPILRNQRWQL